MTDSQTTFWKKLIIGILFYLFFGEFLAGALEAEYYNTCPNAPDLENRTEFVIGWLPSMIGYATVRNTNGDFKCPKTKQ